MSEFRIGKGFHLRKYSQLYAKLKNGPLPKTHSFLVRNKKLTDQAKWMLISCDLGFSFTTLCVLAYMITKHEMLLKGGNFDDVTPKFYRPWIYTEFGDLMSQKHIQKALTRIKETAYVGN